MLWARMVAYVTGTVNQELLLRNEYLGAENRIPVTCGLQVGGLSISCFKKIGICVFCFIALKPMLRRRRACS